MTTYREPSQHKCTFKENQKVMVPFLFLSLKKVGSFGRDTPAVLGCLFKATAKAKAKATRHASFATLPTVTHRPTKASLTAASPLRRAEAEGSRTGGGKPCVCAWDKRRAQVEIQ